MNSRFAYPMVWLVASPLLGCTAIFGMDEGKLAPAGDAGTDASQGGASGSGPGGSGGSAGQSGAGGIGGNGGSTGCTTDCNDGLACTTDTCKGSSCDNAIDAQSCVINKTCVNADATDGTNPCRTCQPSKNQQGYSDVANGAPCGTNMVCFQGQCQACTAGQACTPSNPCKTGLTDCSTGESSCSEAANLPDGQLCETLGICNKGACLKCPTTTGGGPMVPIIGGYCIDATEVTRAQYQAWVATNPTTNGRPSECSWNETWAPGPQSCLDMACASSCSSHPQVCVDWCDAQAYCKDAGKKLCGLVGGGELPYPGYGAIGVTSEWSNACSAGGENTYPYGDNYYDSECRTNMSTTSPVSSHQNCKSTVQGYKGHYDMSGNAEEWLDSCEKKDGQWDYCEAAGGYYDQTAASVTCSHVAPYDRVAKESRRGFRCCWSP